MSRSPLHDLAHPMLLVAGLLTLAAGAWPVGATEPHSVLVTTTPYLIWALLMTLSFPFLAVGIAGLADHRGPGGRALGRTAVALGLLAAVAGFFQNATHAFVQPAYSVVAPAVIDEPPGGLLAIGWLGTLAVMVVGLVTLGVSGYRTRVLPRPAAVSMIVGTLAFPVLDGYEALLFGAGLVWAGAVGLRNRSSALVPTA